MRTIACVLMSAALSLSVGCGILAPSKPVVRNQPAAALDAPDTNSVHSDSMKLAIEIPERRFVVGENIPLTIIATNIGAKTLTFISPSSALYRAVVYREAPNGWERVAEYPSSDISVRRTWTLKAGQTVKYDRVIPVARDWPVDEPLKLVVELRGAPDLKCPMIISATAGKQD